MRKAPSPRRSIRSARAVIFEWPGRRWKPKLAAHLALENLNAGAPLAFSVSEPPRKPGESRPPERRIFEIEAQISGCFVQLAQQLVRGILRQRARISLEETVQSGVIKNALIARIGRLVEAAERLKAEEYGARRWRKGWRTRSLLR